MKIPHFWTKNAVLGGRVIAAMTFPDCTRAKSAQTTSKRAYQRPSSMGNPPKTAFFVPNLLFSLSPEHRFRVILESLTGTIRKSTLVLQCTSSRKQFMAKPLLRPNPFGSKPCPQMTSRAMRYLVHFERACHLLFCKRHYIVSRERKSVFPPGVVRDSILIPMKFCAIVLDAYPCRWP